MSSSNTRSRTPGPTPEASRPARHRPRLTYGVALAAVAACTGTIDLAEDLDTPAQTERPGDRGPSTAPSGGGMAGTPVPGAMETTTPPAGPQALPRASRFARLTHRQWENTVRDLLRLPQAPGLSRRFVVDALRTDFDNVAFNLAVDGTAQTNYREAAETLAAQVTGDATQLGRLLPADLPAEPGARARAFLQRFGQRAYRRPLSQDELDRHLALFDRGVMLVPSEKDAFVAGVRVTLEAFLQSPHFLYRTELGAGTGPKVPLDDWEVASRLSFALTGSMPDDPLFAAAATGKLRNRAGVTAEAERYLATTAGRALLDDFHRQLLLMGDYDHIEKTKEQFPTFVPELRDDMKRETLSFIEDVLLEQKQPLSSLFTAQHTFVNSRLAELYGISGSFTDTAFARVQAPASQRQGLLTHAGFLAANSAGQNPDSIHRGVFIAHFLLCKELPPPVDGVMLPPFDPTKTNRERIDAATGKGTCGAGCHTTLINPAGFAFENYDGLGRYRTTDNGKPVNAADQYPLDGQTRAFRNGLEFSTHIAQSRELHDCYAGKWLSYLHGRELGDEDRPLVQGLGQRLHAERLPVRSLVLALVTGDSFLNRAP